MPEAEFAILVYSDLARWDAMPEESMDDDMTAHACLINDLSESGALVFCSPLAPPREGFRVEVRDEVVRISPEEDHGGRMLAGFYIVRCADRGEATQVAARIPDALTHHVIVRPLLQLEGIASGDQSRHETSLPEEPWPGE